MDIGLFFCSWCTLWILDGCQRGAENTQQTLWRTEHDTVPSTNPGLHMSVVHVLRGPTPFPKSLVGPLDGMPHPPAWTHCLRTYTKDIHLNTLQLYHNSTTSGALRREDSNQDAPSATNKPNHCQLRRATSPGSYVGLRKKMEPHTNYMQPILTGSVSGTCFKHQNRTPSAQKSNVPGSLHLDPGPWTLNMQP